ncbi:MAG: tRNA dihydrouridine synthase DusB [Methanosphaera stadtmanae]|nr:tRNA dihydrouridine synthase DusB [Methanosphaera stadtmanae]
MKWKIGNVKISNQTVLAPMAGINDFAFRKIIKSMGCGLIVNEMVSSASIVHHNKKANEMMYMDEIERPISQQIYGSDPELLKNASQYINETMQPDIISINMGCPVPKVAIKDHAGSALLKNTKLIRQIVEEVVNSVDIPITVKIRSGWDFNNINALEVAKIIEDAGASAITIHPRSRNQMYSGSADWNIIKKVKTEVDIPVIGNGDIFTCYDAKQMLNETNCNAIMIGRGVLGNPWLIKECIDYIDKNIQPTVVPVDEIFDMLKYHVELFLENKNKNYSIKKMKKHAAYYVKGLPGSTKIKEKIFKSNSKNELFNIINEYQEALNNNNHI